MSEQGASILPRASAEDRCALSVVPLFEVNAADIAQQFRRMADEIEIGECDITSMVSVAEADGEIQLYGWGNIDGLRAIGMLNLGMTKLTSLTLDGMAERS